MPSKCSDHSEAKSSTFLNEERSEEYVGLRTAYQETYGFALLFVDTSGRVCSGETRFADCECGLGSDQRRLQIIEQTRYWGETVIQLCCDSGFAMWGVPILQNNQLIGGLIVQGVELENQTSGFHESVKISADALLEIAVEHNLISQAEITLARQQASKEQDRFLALEASKENFVSDDMRGLYLNEEPNLLSAIKQGEIQKARSILNRILICIYSLAGDRLELLKSAVLELVVMMSRAAVEAGADPASVLGNNYHSLTDLSTIDDEEDLADWVRRMLELLIERIQTHDHFPHSLLLNNAVKYMQANLHQQLRRDDVARIAGVSPSHFSKLITERMGRSFSQLLAQMRVERAKTLLCTGQRNLSEIAVECGFFDQSHFNKVFRGSTGHSPGEYRKNSK
jgi:AraC-like DNA-binding protein